ncbi:MAG: hypothetical protein AB1414_19850, partial [bacterium]
QHGGADKVKRFINVNTPHCGSEWASGAWLSIGLPPFITPFLERKEKVLSLVPGLAASIYSLRTHRSPELLGKQIITILFKREGAIYDLMPDSKFLKEVNTTDMPESVSTRITQIARISTDKNII